VYLKEPLHNVANRSNSSLMVLGCTRAPCQEVFDCTHCQVVLVHTQKRGKKRTKVRQFRSKAACTVALNETAGFCKPAPLFDYNVVSVSTSTFSFFFDNDNLTIHNSKRRTCNVTPQKTNSNRISTTDTYFLS
jgi:hypothetical protein